MTRIITCFLILLGACATNTPNNRISSLEQQHQYQVARLNKIKREIHDAELRAKKAHARARFAKCRARVASLRAQVAMRKSQCLQSIARANERRASKSSSTAGGCLLGIFAAVLTGGALGPIAVGGCAAGALSGEARKGRCSLPRCAKRINELDKPVLAAHGLRAYPRCGGDTGLVLRETRKVAPRGLLIDEVGRHTAAAEGGMRKGDILIAVNGLSVRRQGSFAHAMRGVANGEYIDLAFVRNGRLFRTRGRASHFDVDGKLNRERLWIGISHHHVSRNVAYLNGAEIVRVRGPAGAAGLRAGDSIRTINGKRVGSTAEAKAALDEHPAHAHVTLVIRRNGKLRTVQLELGARNRSK